MGGGQAPGCLPGPGTGWPRSGAARAEDRCGGQGAQSQNQGELRAVVGGRGHRGLGGAEGSRGGGRGAQASKEQRSACRPLLRPPGSCWGTPCFCAAHTLLPGVCAPGQERGSPVGLHLPISQISLDLLVGGRLWQISENQIVSQKNIYLRKSSLLFQVS